LKELKNGLINGSVDGPAAIVLTGKPFENFN
jgi:hypothetical protein